MNMKFYTGVGSRSTPEEILVLMHHLAKKLANQDVILRSGGACGADLAFEYGCNKAQGAKEIFRPYQATLAAMELAAQFHPAWDRLPEYSKRLHGRNSFQVMGRDLVTPSSCLICWTPDGCIHHDQRSIETGGTGTAISIASKFKVPTYNLARKDHYELWSKWLNK